MFVESFSYFFIYSVYVMQDEIEFSNNYQQYNTNDITYVGSRIKQKKSRI